MKEVKPREILDFLNNLTSKFKLLRWHRPEMGGRKQVPLLCTTDLSNGKSKASQQEMEQAIKSSFKHPVR